MLKFFKNKKYFFITDKDITEKDFFGKTKKITVIVR